MTMIGTSGPGPTRNPYENHDDETFWQAYGFELGLFTVLAGLVGIFFLMETCAMSKTSGDLPSSVPSSQNVK